MDGDFKNLMQVCASVFTALCFCYFIGTKIPKGKIRLLTLLPIFYLFTILPSNLTSVNLRGTTAFLITWLANFKLLLFSFDQVPLSSNPPKSLLRFISVACLPIKIKQDPFPQSTLNTKNLLSFAIKGLLLALLICIYNHKQHIHPKITMALYGCYVFLALELLFAVGAALARILLGLELEPQSNEPYFATSLQDFWGRRWNLVISSILRPTIYNPIRFIAMGVLDRNWAALPAMLATFIVSAFMHELVFFYYTTAPPTWEVTCFFVLHGVCTAVEVAAKKALPWRLHPAISGPLAIGFVTVTGIWLFIPPIVCSGTDVKGFSEIVSSVEFLICKLRFISTIS